MENINSIGHYYVLCVVFKVIVRAVLCALCDICCSETKATLPRLNFNNLLVPMTLSITFGNPARVAMTLLPLSTCLDSWQSCDDLQEKHHSSACCRENCGLYSPTNEGALLITTYRSKVQGSGVKHSCNLHVVSCLRKWKQEQICLTDCRS